MSEAGLAVEVIHALPLRQWRVALRVAPGSTVADAIRLSGLAQQVPGLVVDDGCVGIFSMPAGLSTPLRDGDRVEIYRELQCDPKQVRRERAARARPAR